MRLHPPFRAVLLFCVCVLFHFAPAALAAPEDWEVGKVVPDTYGYDQNGQLIALRDLAGKNVVFEVSAAWCGPSFVLAVQANAAKQYLEQKGIPFEYITVIAQDPLGGELPLRSQGLAWQQEFGTQSPILSYFNGPNLPKMHLIGASRWLIQAAGDAFPAMAFIGPDQIIRKIHAGAMTPDQLIAEFLPDQPSLPEIPLPPASLALERAKLTVKMGSDSGSTTKPLIDMSGPGFVVPAFDRGTLPEDFAGGISTKRAPRQEVWTVHFQGHSNPFDGSEGFPSDKSIKIILSSIRWSKDGKRGMLTAPMAKVRLYDNMQGMYVPTLDVPVVIKSGNVIVGPFKLDTVSGLYPLRYMQVEIVWLAQEPSLAAAFLGDYVTLQFDLGTETQDLWSAKLREIEEAAKTPTQHRRKTLASIDQFSQKVRRHKGPGLPSEGRKYILNNLSRIRALVRDAK